MTSKQGCMSRGSFHPCSLMDDDRGSVSPPVTVVTCINNCSEDINNLEVGVHVRLNPSISSTN